jgi:hypothetical protein
MSLDDILEFQKQAEFAFFWQLSLALKLRLDHQSLPAQDSGSMIAWVRPNYFVDF